MALPTESDVDAAVPVAARPNRPLTNALLKSLITVTTGNTFTTVTGDKTLALTDLEFPQWVTAEADLLIPTNAAVAFPGGSMINVIVDTTASVTVTGDTGVVVNGSSGGTVTLGDRYTLAVLLKMATDTWIVLGGA